jgi:hypothetical protein
MENSTDDSIDTITTGLGTIANDSYSYMNNLLSNPSLIIILVVVLVLYVILFLSLGDKTTSQGSSDTVSNSGSSKITIIFIAFFIILIIINGLQYFFGVDIVAKLKYLFTGSPEIDITVDPSRREAAKNDVPQILLRPQVFNIPENKYVYPDAKAICSAYGARLATYSEVEDAYKNGGEWCNYGWSDGQMALFPTQQKTFDKLQEIEGHENDCGRPGVNGGYIANPAVRFGVNCYGFKPRMTETDKYIMANDSIYPKTMKDLAMEKRVNYWKERLSEILVSPFNHNTWSKL